jgi:SAM-dependent methyltransferase
VTGPAAEHPPADVPRPFACLWCGRAWQARDADDLEARARLCPDCLARAGENPFLRFRLHRALEERAASAARQAAVQAARASTAGVPATGVPATGPAPDAPGGPATGVPATGVAATGPATDAAGGPATGGPRTDATVALGTPDASDVPVAPVAPGERASATRSRTGAWFEDQLVPYYEARAAEYDDWYLRRGRYAHGPVQDMAWQMELDAATTWLDGLPLRGEIVELAAGTGWWSALLATKGELYAYDAAAAPLDLARDRLIAHRLRAHLHVRDAWAAPDRAVDTLFTGFWLSHVPRPRLAEFLDLARRWLKPGSTFAAIDSLPDPASGTVDRLPAPGPDLSRRRLVDGREFTIPKVLYAPDEMERALDAAGFAGVDVRTTGRFFLLASATAP